MTRWPEFPELLGQSFRNPQLLAPLAEQAGHIFITQQIVDEVLRNKLQVAAAFLTQKLKALKLQTFNIPDHLSGTGVGQNESILKQMKSIVTAIQKANAEVDALALGIMEQISRSEDEVSKALAPIFAQRVSHSDQQLTKGRIRRELGNPPGKSSDPLGDQLTWELILANFKGRRRLWIISRDGDYGATCGGRVFLNPFLYDELRQVSSDSEVYLFEGLVEGLNHFVETTGVEAQKRLTPEEAQELQSEEQSLPHSTEPIPYSRDVLANLTGITQPSETMRRAMEEVARFSKPDERTLQAMNSVAEQIGRFYGSSERTLGTMQDVAKEVSKLMQPDERTRRMMAEVAEQITKLTQPSDATRRILEQIQESQENIQRMTAKVFPPRDPPDET